MKQKVSKEEVYSRQDRRPLIMCAAQRIAVAIMVVIAVVACSDDDDTANRLRFPKGEKVGYEEGSQFLEIYSDAGTEWTVTMIVESGPGDWIALYNGQTTGSGNDKIRVDYGWNYGATERSALFSVDFGGRQTKSIRLTQKNKEGTIGEVLPALLELPEVVEKDNLVFVTHYIPNTDRMRNYSILYDTENHIPLWVAYPMHQIYTGGSGRTDAWAYDPKISTSLQPNLSTGMGNGYDRGHMIPSASRYYTGSNAQTFYYTNMTPQNNTFNAGTWANMETKVRGWRGGVTTATLTDTLYVVTGAVLKTVGGNESVKYVTARQSPNMQIAVPNYYYKAVMKRTMSGTTPSYKAVAFWFDHEAVNRNVQWSDAITVRELEAKTGFNFFAGLDQEIQDSIEDVLRASDWGF